MTSPAKLAGVSTFVLPSGADGTAGGDPLLGQRPPAAKAPPEALFAARGQRLPAAQAPPEAFFTTPEASHHADPPPTGIGSGCADRPRRPSPDEPSRADRRQARHRGRLDEPRRGGRDDAGGRQP